MRITQAELAEIKQELNAELEKLKNANARIQKLEKLSADIEEWHAQTDAQTIDIGGWHEVADDYIKSIELLSKQSEIDKPKIENYKKDLEMMITLFKKQKDEIQDIIDDANRASMAGSFKKQKDDINTKMRWADAFLIAALIVTALISL